jgi:mannose-6-phosphate isomerase-like protein (cupin superfamily)
MQSGEKRQYGTEKYSRRRDTWKVVIRPSAASLSFAPTRATTWLYVLPGRMRLILGDHDFTIGPGEVAEFDTRRPHWFGPARHEPVEILSLHGSRGERMHVRAAPRGKSKAG